MKHSFLSFSTFIRSHIPLCKRWKYLAYFHRIVWHLKDYRKSDLWSVTWTQSTEMNNILRSKFNYRYKNSVDFLWWFEIPPHQKQSETILVYVIYRLWHQYLKDNMWYLLTNMYQMPILPHFHDVLIISFMLCSWKGSISNIKKLIKTQRLLKCTFEGKKWMKYNEYFL